MIHKIYTPPDFSSTKFTVVLFSEKQSSNLFHRISGKVVFREVFEDFDLISP